MKEKLKKKWVQALRGKAPEGEYQQTTGLMHESTECGDHFCCLGVLRNITTGFGPTRDVGYVQARGMPNSKEFGSWGLTYWEMQELVSMNDSGQSFAEIADYIERNVR